MGNRKGVQSVSIKLTGTKATKLPYQNLSKIGKLIEGIVRVVSALDEQLHAGTNFYLMTDSQHFSSNGKYIPLPEIIAIPPMIVTLVHYIPIYGSERISYMIVFEPIVTYLIKCLVSFVLPSVAMRINGSNDLATTFICLSIGADLLIILAVKIANRVIGGKRNNTKETRIARGLFSKVAVGVFCFSWPAWNVAIGVGSILIFYPFFYFGAQLRDSRIHEKVVSTLFLGCLLYGGVSLWSHFDWIETGREIIKKAVLDFVLFDSHFYYFVEMGLLNITMILVPNIFF